MEGIIFIDLDYLFNNDQVNLSSQTEKQIYIFYEFPIVRPLAWSVSVWSSHTPPNKGG